MGPISTWTLVMDFLGIIGRDGFRHSVWPVLGVLSLRRRHVVCRVLCGRMCVCVCVCVCLHVAFSLQHLVSWSLRCSVGCLVVCYGLGPWGSFGLVGFGHRLVFLCSLFLRCFVLLLLAFIRGFGFRSRPCCFSLVFRSSFLWYMVNGEN